MLCITNNSIKQSFVYIPLNDQRVPFQTIQFRINTIFCLHTVKYENNSISNNSVEHKYKVYMSNSSIWHIDRPLSGATAPGQSGPESNGREGVLHIPQSSSITEASPSDSWVSYLGHSLGECYPSAEMQSVYTAAPAKRAKWWCNVISLHENFKDNNVFFN